MASARLFGAIEGGGTKFICAVATAPDRILERANVATTHDPRDTMAECVRFFTVAQRSYGPIAAFGFGCFGPIEVRTDAPDLGRMMTTPKPGWANADVLEALRKAFGVPIVLDTDVGAAALAGAAPRRRARHGIAGLYHRRHWDRRGSSASGSLGLAPDARGDGPHTRAPRPSRCRLCRRLPVPSRLS